MTLAIRHPSLSSSSPSQMQFYAGSRTDEMDENIEDLFIGVGYFTLNGPKIILFNAI